MREKQAEIIKALGVSANFDAEQEIRKSVDFLKDYLKKNTFLKTLVLGISGGQDSTLAGKLSQMAITEMRQGTGNDQYQFIAVRLPYGEQADESDAMDAITFMEADKVMRVNVQAAVDAGVAAVEANGLTVSDFNKGNIKARERMVAQYTIAGEVHGAVVGTDHAAEAVTGFYTKYGDGGTDIDPLYRLDKRQGKAMLKVLNAPEHLYLKVPTADLEDNRPALPDEVALGVTYDDIDNYLEGKTIKDADADKIENWYNKTMHKRHMPITIFDNFWR
ncbi:MAG: ammonia-dependent NAD(+) synthetase [Furfurilactobacillus sp.]|jgi:NAD+ synthase|uniref:NH(3)-dependent NAD(+) synthetase n=1 Tax=Furfurilactobacillus milii TaxID=2888272 RepID=A0ABT6DC26_9LACO|nr:MULTISPECIES: ammonia-dependent NAD(+) synthetase [Furfurilactobacillus]QLE65995.1 NAD synthetase [Furfurilactobacillus rossiae]MCF6161735.1 ammonia-dependent NAD(+) synthetase [Furfurilactobacillus milii]MCF6164150.1 ammonia-dependent NAD(+) synthetase [Furfurilactobacillus milii]MCF6419611.1 ammonia-dependent NAD(+) synthetase [Furfurilactobacillus milii]MCH4012514.1 ammonia-dependent NAD(+) synthetase [Furfurilactobacillus sp.]